MDGEFVCEEYAYQQKAIGGGNFLVVGKDIDSVLKASEVAVSKMKKLRNIILPFPGGIVRSGSKVGSKYKKLIASTNFEYCPTMRGLKKLKISANSGCVLEIVIATTTVPVFLLLEVTVSFYFGICRPWQKRDECCESSCNHCDCQLSRNVVSQCHSASP